MDGSATASAGTSAPSQRVAYFFLWHGHRVARISGASLEDCRARFERDYPEFADALVTTERAS